MTGSGREPEAGAVRKAAPATSFAEMRCMHWLSVHGETRRFHAWMHGLHASPARSASLRPLTGP